MMHKKKILIIDDEVNIRQIIALKLKSHGYQVVIAENGEEGLSIIQSQKPEAVITDIMMPHLDGKSLCKKTNELKKERPFLTIVMSCRIATDEYDWINSMDTTMFMEKPFSPSKLLDMVDRYFEDKL